MKIDRDFVSGNIEVLDIREDTVTLANELRDTRADRDWFYWAFRVKGAQGKTVTFQFPHIKRVGYCVNRSDFVEMDGWTKGMDRRGRHALRSIHLYLRSRRGRGIFLL